MIRVRRQHVVFKERHSVEIVSLDIFTRFARKLDNTATERQHLLRLLNTKLREGDHLEQYYKIKDWVFWLEKP